MQIRLNSIYRTSDKSENLPQRALHSKKIIVITNSYIMAITLNYQFTTTGVVVVRIILHCVMNTPLIPIFNYNSVVSTTAIISWVYTYR